MSPFKDRMFLVVALEYVDDLGKSFCVIMCFTVTAIKPKKELSRNVNWKMFRITVDYFGGNLTSNIEINVLLNRRPMCKFHQPMAVIMLRDPVITVQKKVDHFYRSVKGKIA